MNLSPQPAIPAPLSISPIFMHLLLSPSQSCAIVFVIFLLLSLGCANACFHSEASAFSAKDLPTYICSYPLFIFYHSLSFSIWSGALRAVWDHRRSVSGPSSESTWTQQAVSTFLFQTDRATKAKSNSRTAEGLSQGAGRRESIEG